MEDNSSSGSLSTAANMNRLVAGKSEGSGSLCHTHVYVTRPSNAHHPSCPTCFAPKSFQPCRRYFMSATNLPLYPRAEAFALANTPVNLQS